MIAGLDSSWNRPDPGTAATARAEGIRVWGGYIGIRPAGELGLAMDWSTGRDCRWSQADFDVVRSAGMTPIGFCSGWDDPVAIRDLAASWKVLPCVDVETGIRSDGGWVQGWLDASGAGLYGLSTVHSARRAAFHVIAWYGAFPPDCSDMQATWPNWLVRPDAPCGWQFCGTHDEFGLSVDRGWYDDWFNGVFSGGEIPDMTDEQAFMLHEMHDQMNQLWSEFVKGTNEAGTGTTGQVLLEARDRVKALEAAVGNLGHVANLEPVLDAIAELKADLDGLTLKRA